VCGKKTKGECGNIWSNTTRDRKRSFQMIGAAKKGALTIRLYELKLI